MRLYYSKEITYRFLLTFQVIFLLFTFQSSFSQSEYTATTIIFSLSPRETLTIPAIDVSGIEYIEANTFLKTLSLPFVVNDTTKKIEFLAGNYLIRFSVNNPFVVLTERRTNNISVHQMSYRVLRIENAFYVPLIQLITFIRQTTNKQLTYNPEQRIISEGIATSRYDITDIAVEQKTNGYLLTLTTTKQLTEVESWLKPDGWFFITISNATADTQKLLQTKLEKPIKKLLVFQSPTSIQLTFKLDSEIEQAELITEPNNTNLLFALRSKKTYEIQKPKPKKDLSKERERWKMDVIVIDPGHGGKDPGAIGLRGTREKDITLSVALKLGALIEKYLPDVKVVYTRKTDTFVELYRRTQIANETGGKLFISIHCNSTERKPSSINGFEIYLLRPNKTDEAIAIAAKENAVIQLEEGYQNRYRELTEEEFIIITMAQSAYMKYSELYASVASESIDRHLELRNNGVKQAGFFVLVGASMPNVLVELGYLSNRSDEEFLRSDQGQRKIAFALFESIRRFKQEYEQALNQ